MSVCPFCGHVNTQGVDECAECQASLTDLHLADPLGPIESGVLTDRVEVLRGWPPRIVPPDLSVGEVLAILAGEARGCVLVVDDDRIVGIFSERDALLRLGPDADRLVDRPVSEFMTPDPECLQTTAKIAFALQRMDLGGYRHVPVVDATGHAVSVISIRDILRYLTTRMADTAER